MLLSAQHIEKTYTDTPILNDISFSIEEGEKIGLIGVNGTGKSTLLKVLAGIEDCSGTISRRKNLKISALWQNPVFEKETVWQEVLSQNASRSHPLEEYEMKSILTRLDIADYNARIAALSGGQQRKLSLALTLMGECDLLLLDEPTNHLDTEIISWLEGQLKKSKTALLMVSHDRYFLDSVCTRLFELDHGRLYVHEGNYASYLEHKEERRQLEIEKARKLENIYRKELAWVKAGVQARGTKQKGRLQRFEELRKERSTVLEREMELMPAAARLGKKTIALDHLSFSYVSEQPLFSDFSYQFARRDRIGVIGKNGCGKSTLLQILAGLLQPVSGTIETGDTVRIAYYSQKDPEIDFSQRVLDYIEESAKVIWSQGKQVSASAMLERFLFDKDLQYLPVSRLSGGERKRLYLLKTLMEMPNVLLLDEPTNDLDLITLEILEDYLDEFPGIVVAVSHDRYFLDRVCDTLWVFDNNQITAHTGSYLGYAMEPVKKQNNPKEKKSYKAERRKQLSYMEKKELETLSRQMEQLEQEISQLNEKISSEQNMETLRKLSDSRDEKEQELETCTLWWMELEEKRENLAA